ncbi:O-antigen ligase family protein [Patescibacteria group bacterium]|nr:O-antigen ligase family protein [Patescibacteria group bacterium]
MNEHKGLEKILLNIITIGSVLVVMVPLIVVKESFFPYIVFKTIIFRIIVEAVFFSWLILLCYFPKYRPKTTLLFWSLAIFVFIWFVTTFTSLSVIKSFWGDSERMGGFFNFLHYFLWWVVLVNVFTKIKQWYRLLKFTLGVSVLICFYSLAQYFDLNLPFVLQSGLSRVNSTIGNAAYLASYLLFHLYISWYFFVKAKIRSEKYVYFLIFFLQLIILFLTATRGAQLAFVFTIILFLLFSFILKFYKEKSMKFLIIFSIILILFGLSITLFHQQPWVKNNYYFQRFSDISISNNTIQTRFIAWKAAWEGFKERPIFGVGPENFSIVFNKYLTPDFFQYTGGEIWFDRAHNTIFDMLTMLGIFGLLSYLSIFVVVLKILWDFYKKQGYPAQVVIIALIFIAYFIQNIFVFDSINSYIPLFLLLGLVDFLNRINTTPYKTDEEFLRKRSKVPVVIPVLFAIAIFSLLLFGINIREVRANKYSFKGIVAARAGQTGNYQEFKENFEKSIKTAINPIDHIFLLAEHLPEIIYKNRESLSQEQIKEDFNQVEHYAQEAIKLDPFNVHNNFLLIKLYNNFAQLTGDNKYIKGALGELKVAKELSPKRIQLLWQEAQSYVLANLPDKALASLDQSIALIDSIPYPYWLKYVIYSRAGNNDLAYQNATLAIKNDFQFNNIEEVLQLLPHYQETNEEDILIYLYQSLISLESQEPGYYEELISLYLQRNEKQKARDIIRQAVGSIPDFNKKAYEMFPDLNDL